MSAFQRELLNSASKMLDGFASSLYAEALALENETEARNIELGLKPRTSLQIKKAALERADHDARLAFDLAANGKPRESSPDISLVGADVVINSPGELAGEVELRGCFIRVNCEKPFSRMRRGSIIDGCTILYGPTTVPLISFERSNADGGRVSDPPVMVTNNVFRSEGEK